MEPISNVHFLKSWDLSYGKVGIRLNSYSAKFSRVMQIELSKVLCFGCVLVRYLTLIIQKIGACFLLNKRSHLIMLLNTCAKGK